MNTTALTNPTIGVVVVNYKTPDLVVDGLRALENERVVHSGIHVVVVDNFSGDDSVPKLRSAIESNAWSNWVKLVESPTNGGFSYGNNRGFKSLTEWLNSIDYYWLLNPDTEVQPGATQALLDSLTRNPRCIVGSRLMDRDGTPQCSTFNFPSLVSEMCSGFQLGILDRLLSSHTVWQDVPEYECQVDWLAGASLMFTASVFEQIGLMDEEYFLYFEEVDYLLHAKLHGVPCRYVPGSEVFHEVGAATGISDERKEQPRKPSYWFESRTRYFRKNHGRLYSFSTDAAFVIGYCTWLLRKRAVDAEVLKLQPPFFLRDFIKHSQLNPMQWSRPSTQ